MAKKDTSFAQENSELEKEMQGTEGMDTSAPENTGNDAGKAEGNAEETDTRKWYDDNGNEISKSAFIRLKFKQNMSRKDISEQFEIPYRTVYGATVNMENDAEPTSKGRGQTFSRIHVTADGHVVFMKDNVLYINNIAQPEGTEAPATTEVDRNTWIKEQIAAGKNRGDIAKALDLSYGVIYGITKEEQGTRQKYEVEVDDPQNPGQKITISRSEYIRRRVADGISKADIAKELGVEYSVVWQATKQLKTTEERFVDAVKGLEKFLDMVDNPDDLTKAITLLGSVKIKQEVKEKVDVADSSEK
jgi:hypothetical protein